MYHIYNRGINSCAIFTETTNYEHFRALYEKHISPVADTFARVLKEEKADVGEQQITLN